MILDTSFINKLLDLIKNYKAQIMVLDGNNVYGINECIYKIGISDINWQIAFECDSLKKFLAKGTDIHHFPNENRLIGTFEEIVDGETIKYQKEFRFLNFSNYITGINTTLNRMNTLYHDSNKPSIDLDSIEAGSIIRNICTKDGTKLVNIDGIFLYAYNGLIPLNKSDKVYVSYMIRNDNKAFILKFDIKKKGISFTEYIPVLALS